jgi:F420-dependent oxidoreductase-like protein
MRHALMIEGQEGVTWDEWAAIAQACEEHGVEALFRSDHYLSVEGQTARGSLDAWATISALAAVTSTLRLGTLVSPATFRHPSELAKVVATADHVSGGRVELGMGTGWLEDEHRAYGFAFPPLKERMDRLAEQLEVVTGEWADGRARVDGRYFSIDVDAAPKPVQRPRPNLLLGGSGGPRSLALAARHVDEYNTVYETAGSCARIRADLDAACERAGREPIPLSLMTGWLVGDDESDLLDRAGRLAELRGHDGGAESFVESLPDAWITGTIDQARERLRELEEAGVHRVMLQNLLHRDLNVVAQIGRLS